MFLRAVLPPNRIDCRRTGGVVLRQQSGVIGSVVTEETDCGSADAPWIIQARPGQTINLTMHDFALPIGNNGTASGSRYKPLMNYAIILNINNYILKITF